MHRPLVRLLAILCACLCVPAARGEPAQPHPVHVAPGQAPLAPATARTAVTTYHYDTLRTGWNSQETTLSANAFPATFGVQQTVTLDDQVDAQPLLMPAEHIAGGVHDVLYVVTENNTIYALDAASGAVLVQRNLGAPVPTPLGCGNNGPNVGITSTPVIDTQRQRLYVMAYLNGAGGAAPRYELHALNLATLADALPAVVVAASQKLSDGSTFQFNATYQRQRPGLLELNGRIYAGFGSFCDFSASQSRGWVLGWSASNLAPLAHATLNDTQATSPTSFFLSSVWMSGFGLAGDTLTDDVYFSTGNSDCNFYVAPEACPSQTTYDGVTNVQESVVAMTGDLSRRAALYTPSNVYTLDVEDADLGASGVMLVPMGGNSAGLATIVSKDGRLWLLNRANLATPLDMQQLAAGCWCGPSYFQGSDGIRRVVSSAGDALQTWQVATSPAPHLVAEASAYVQQSEQDPGFFTTVSSNGTRAGTPILWAVARPSTTASLTLYAYAATASGGGLQLLYTSPAGQWPNLGGNANITPVVANGRVYVASYRTLMIFGANGHAVAAAAFAPASPAALPPGISRRVTGTLVHAQGARLTLQTRAGALVSVDAGSAAAREQLGGLTIGHAYTVLAVGERASGELDVVAVTRAKHGMTAWPADR